MVLMVHRVLLPIQKDLFWVSFDNDVYKALEAPGPGPGLGVGLHQGLVTPAEPVRPRLDLRVLTNCEFLKGGLFCRRRPMHTLLIVKLIH